MRKFYEMACVEIYILTHFRGFCVDTKKYQDTKLGDLTFLLMKTFCQYSWE